MQNSLVQNQKDLDMTSTPRNDVTGHSRQVCIGKKKALKNNFFVVVENIRAVGAQGLEEPKFHGGEVR